MSHSRSVRAGRAHVEAWLDDRRLQRGLKRAQARLKVFAAGVRRAGFALTGIGAAIVAPIVAGSAVFARMGDAVAKMARRTGISTEALSELGYAAERSGMSVGQMEVSLRRMQRSISDAGRGLSTATDALATLGLSVEQVRGLSPETQFYTIAQALSQVKDPTQRAATAMEIFGRAGSMLLPMVADGAAGIDELREQARALGLSIAGPDALAAEVYTDAMLDLKSSLKMVAFAIGSSVAPVLTKLTKGFAAAVGSVTKFIREHKPLIVGILAIGAAIFALGVGLLTLSGIILALKFVLAGLGTLLAVITSPLLLIPVLLAALAAGALYAFDKLGSALGGIGAAFGTLKGDALAAFTGIKDALAAGDWALAAKILWLTLKMEWRRGIAWLVGLWEGFKLNVLTIAGSVYDRLLKIMAGGWNGARALWVITTNTLTNIWADFVAGILSIWNGAAGLLKKAWARLRSWFDSEADYETEAKRIDAETRTAAEKIAADRARKQAEADASYSADLARIGQEYEGVAGELDAEAKGRQAERQAEAEAAKREAQAEYDAARLKWQEATAEEAKPSPSPAAEVSEREKLKARFEAAKEAAKVADKSLKLAQTKWREAVQARMRVTADQPEEERKATIAKLKIARGELQAAQAKSRTARDELHRAAQEAKAGRRFEDVRDRARKTPLMAGEVLGTFSGRGLAGMAYGTAVMDRIADATEETAANTKEGLEFA